MNTDPVIPISPLRLAVIGIGGIGSTIAFQLSAVGRHEVTVIARPGSPRLRQLTEHNGIIDVEGRRAEVRVRDALDEDEAYDAVIVTVLAHQVDSVLPALQASRAKAILFIFNNFDPERLIDAVGVERCQFGMPFIQGHITGDGKLKSVIGAGGQKTKLSSQHWVDIFRSAGLPAILEPNMTLWLRCHVPLCIAFESVSVTSVRRGSGASWKEAMTLARGVHESFRLIRGLGYEIYPRSKARLSRSPTWIMAIILWSVSRIKSFRELLSTGAGECRALIDVLVLAAPPAKPGISVDRILAMKPLISE